MKLKPISPASLPELNAMLAELNAQQRLQWAMQNLPAQHACSSSFGAQSAALLHMLAEIAPAIPIMFVDTGFLFPETYEFARQLSDRLDLNVVRTFPVDANRWAEVHVAGLQSAGLEAITRYNQTHKVEPMQRLLSELQVGTWFAGLRRTQSQSRSGLAFLHLQAGRWKLNPLADWTDRKIGQYLQQHDLPYHPLWEKGYVSIGDRYLTSPLTLDASAEHTRFFGLKRECGLHDLH